MSLFEYNAVISWSFFFTKSWRIWLPW